MKQFLAILTFVSLASPAVGTTARAPIEGRWSNPKDSVVIEVAPCGSAYCGTVIKATAKAKADAREGGIASLVGTQLMTGFKPVKDGYRGKVLLPKRGIQATGTIRQLGSNTLAVKGCLVAGILCKEQRWDRIR